MKATLNDYCEIVGEEVIELLVRLARPLSKKKVVHVNSTRTGGGVAEILDRLIPVMCELGIDATWEVIEGNDDFYQATKGMHNGLQGKAVDIPEKLLRGYEETNRQNLENLKDTLSEA
ncbi:MAG: glycosyl transferase family 1, partial [candidate division Zixibacteria bacterium]|nr:glycosyl transferase family 1 [candidate division Zixibacteria bacterium]